MTNLTDYAKDLIEKAAKATPEYSSYILTPNPSDITALAKAFLEQQEALREAEEAMRRIENPVLHMRPSYADWELRLIARDWLKKYAKGEK